MAWFTSTTPPADHQIGYVRAVRIAVGSDHAGFQLKEHVKTGLEEGGHVVVDVGTDSAESVDYPQFAGEAAALVAEGKADRAVLACGSGVGVAIVANKVSGARAVNAHDPQEAEMSRRHNDANVVTLSGARLAPDAADAIVAAFLRTEFEGGRHARRVGQIGHIDGSVSA
jgi:ribose 5-phosphate isomerase B